VKLRLDFSLEGLAGSQPVFRVDGIVAMNFDDGRKPVAGGQTIDGSDFDFTIFVGPLHSMNLSIVGQEINGSNKLANDAGAMMSPRGEATLTLVLITLSAVVISPRFLSAALRCLMDYEDFIMTVRINRSTYKLSMHDPAPRARCPH
jgi:hypothetical protein